MKKTNNNIQFEEDSKYEIIFPISHFYALPFFKIKDPTNNKELIDSFYDTAIKLIQDFDMGNKEMFKYLSGNFNAHSVKNKEQLIGYLLREKEIPARNDSRFRIGFRSIYTILYESIDKIDADYISEINSMLKPFYDNYKYKEALVLDSSMN